MDVDNYFSQEGWEEPVPWFCQMKEHVDIFFLRQMPSEETDDVIVAFLYPVKIKSF